MGTYGGFSLDIEDFKKYNKTLKGAIIGYNPFVKSFMNQMGQRFVAIVKPKTPKDTGELRRNWQVGDLIETKDNIEVEILNGKDYASYVENGHRVHNSNKVVKPRFMMRKTSEIMRKYIPKAYSLQFMNYLKSKGVE